MSVTRRQAVFLDRDGVITEPVLNPATGLYESPHRVQDVRLYPRAISALQTLQKCGFALFVVSNQPSHAKGKVPLDVLRAIASQVERGLKSGGVRLQAAYYCYHHPNGVVSPASGACKCRKPEPYFLLKAQREHGIDLSGSWMIGDRDSDVECGQRAGCRTILVFNPLELPQTSSAPDYTANDLNEATEIIMKHLMIDLSVCWKQTHGATR